MLHRNVLVPRCLTNCMRNRDIRVKLLSSQYWSDANNIRAQSIRKLPKSNEPVVNKPSRKNDRSFPDIRLRDIPASRSNLNERKSESTFAQAFEGLQRREFNTQRITKITGTDIIFLVIEIR